MHSSTSEVINRNPMLCVQKVVVLCVQRVAVLCVQRVAVSPFFFFCTEFSEEDIM